MSSNDLSEKEAALLAELMEPSATLSFAWKSRDGSPQECSIPLSLRAFFTAYKALHKLKEDERAALAALIGALTKGVPTTYLEDERILIGLNQIQLGRDEQWTDPDDPLLSFCYHMLRGKHLSRAEVAQIAARELQKKLSTPEEWDTWRDAWRKRVDRWAEARQLPKVEQRKRKRGR